MIVCCIALPGGTTITRRLNTPERSMEPNAYQRRPQMSRVSVSTASAGNSVALAIVKVMKISSGKLEMFRMCPS